MWYETPGYGLGYFDLISDNWPYYGILGELVILIPDRLRWKYEFGKIVLWDIPDR